MDTPGMDFETLTGTRDQARVDDENLNTLATCHIVLGALVALFSCLFIAHIVMGVMMMRTRSSRPEWATWSPSSVPPPCWAAGRWVG